MARRQRSFQIELNFDGLTDSITNLVGALIVLVLILLGIMNSPRLLDVQREKAAGEAAAEAESVDDLLQEMQLLQARLALINSQMNAVESELPELKEKIVLLSKQAISEPGQ
jgi:hypothetical protein